MWHVDCIIMVYELEKKEKKKKAVTTTKRPKMATFWNCKINGYFVEIVLGEVTFMSFPL